MLEDLIIETEPIDTTNLSEQEKVVIDDIEETEMIRFDLTTNYIGFCDKYGWWYNYWNLINDEFGYSYEKIHKILRNNYQYNYQQLNKLVKDILLKYYKINIRKTKPDMIIPIGKLLNRYPPSKWIKISNL